MDGDIKSTKNPDTNLISEKAWRLVLNLECTDPNFDGIVDSIATQDIESWREWI